MVKISELQLTIEWWFGTYSTNWNPWKTNGKVNTETVPKNAAIKTIILTKAQRIHKNDVTELKKLYSTVEMM